MFLKTKILLSGILVFAFLQVPQPAKATVNPDLTGDGCTNQEDFLLFKNVWGGTSGQADYNQDGKINVRDLAILMKPWLQGCSRINAQSPFGIEYGRGYRNIPGAPTALSAYWKETGAKWTKMNDVSWEMIEPNAPVSGVHTYNWNILDHDISKEVGLANFDKPNWDQDFEIAVVLRSLSPWGMKPYTEPPGIGRPGRPPKDENLADYRAWVKAVVERYDDDGFQDAPDLTRGVAAYEIESEGGFLPNNLFYYATAEEYVLQLRTAYEAAKEADPDVKIILNGINLRDFFADGETTEQVMTHIESLNYPDTAFSTATLMGQGLQWMRDVFELGKNYFDIVENHELGEWRQMSGNVNWIEEQLQAVGIDPNTKEIWAGDALSAPQVTYISGIELNPPFGQRLSIEGAANNSLAKNLQLFSIMGSNGAIYTDLQCVLGAQAATASGCKPTDTVYQAHIVNDKAAYDAWFRKLQAEDVVKKYVYGLASGYNLIMMGNLEDWPTFSGFPLQGFTDTNNVFNYGAKRPMFYAYKQMVEKLEGISYIARVETGNQQVYFYEIVKSDGSKIYVAWMDDGENEHPTQAQPTPTYPSLLFDVPIVGSQATVTQTITTRGVTTPTIETKIISNGKLPLTLTKTPVFIEAQ